MFAGSRTELGTCLIVTSRGRKPNTASFKQDRFGIQSSSDERLENSDEIWRQGVVGENSILHTIECDARMCGNADVDEQTLRQR